MKKSVTIILIGLIFIAGFVPAFAASPLTEIQDQIKDLLAKFQATSVPIVTECSVPLSPLALGSYGPEVKKLQVWLGQHGYPVVPAGKESQYFGPLTHFALIKFQTAAGIRPVSGFYGPITKTEIEKRCVAEEATRFGLQVSIAKDSGKSMTIPAGSVRVEILKFDLVGKSTLDALTIHRYGEEVAGFTDVYLFDGDIRISSGYDFDEKNGTITFTDLAYAIDGKKTLSVVGNITKANDFVEDGVEIVSAQSLIATGSIVGDFPIRSGFIYRSEGKVGNLTISKDGSSLIDPVIGQQAVRVAEFRIVPDIIENVLLRSITLTVAGSVDPSLISNFTLKLGDQVVALASTVNARNHIMLRFDEPLTLAISAPVQFALYADIAPTVEPGETLRIYLKEPIDLYATGVTAKQGVPVLAARYNNSARNGTDASWLTIRGGVVTYAFRGPVVTNYAAGQKGIELMRFDIEAQDMIEMREMRVALTAGGADASGTLMTVGGLCNLTKANYTDVKLVDANTGAVLTRGLDVACVTGDQDNTQTLVFIDRWQVGAGQTRTVKVIANVAAFTPATGETIKATLMAFEREDIRNLVTGNYLNTREVVPAGSIAGATHRVHANEQVANLANTLATVLSDAFSSN